MMTKEEILALAVTIANDNEIDHELVLAIITVESNFNTYAHRFEPAWRYCLPEDKIKWFASHCGLSESTERIDQCTSFGLMQVMGSVARELGYQGNLADLYEPQYGVLYGVLKLKELVDKYSSLDDVIVSYNGGSPVKINNGLYRNQDYLDKVRKALDGISKG